jgi:hypothetical protein
VSQDELAEKVLVVLLAADRPLRPLDIARKLRRDWQINASQWKVLEMLESSTFGAAFKLHRTGWSAIQTPKKGKRTGVERVVGSRHKSSAPTRDGRLAAATPLALSPVAAPRRAMQVELDPQGASGTVRRRSPSEALVRHVDPTPSQDPLGKKIRAVLVAVGRPIQPRAIALIMHLEGYPEVSELQILQTLQSSPFEGAFRRCPDGWTTIQQACESAALGATSSLVHGTETPEPAGAGESGSQRWQSPSLHTPARCGATARDGAPISSDELAKKILAVLVEAGVPLQSLQIAKLLQSKGLSEVSQARVLEILHSSRYEDAFQRHPSGWSTNQPIHEGTASYPARSSENHTAIAGPTPDLGPLEAGVASLSMATLGEAILVERDAQRRSRPKRPIRVTSVVLVQELPTGKFIYEITVNDRIRLHPDQPFKLITPVDEILAEVIEAEGHTVSCVVGRRLTGIRLELEFDPAFIMTALHRRLIQENWTNRGLASLVMQKSGWSASVEHATLPNATPVTTGRAKLNPQQQRAFTRATEERVHLIWGPPGTGKTTTLGRVIRRLVEAGRSTLLVSLSHVAVDQMCLAFLRDASDDLKHALVRHGTPRDRTLDAYSPDAATARDCPELIEKLAALQATLADLDRSIRAHEASRAAVKARLADDIRSLDAKRETVRADIRVIRATVGTERLKAVSSRKCHAATLAALVVSKSLDAINFDAVVLDEASMVAMPWVLAAAANAGRQLIIAGDPKQLPPIVASESGGAKAWFGSSVFSHVGVDDPTSHPSLTFLDEQHRMPAEVANLVSNLSYQGKLRTAASRASRADADEGIRFVSTEGLISAGAVYSRHVMSYYNPVACALLTALLGEMELSPNEPTYILTPFRSQARLLEAIARDAGLVETRVGTIHTAQGSERQTVIVDLTEHDPGRITHNRLLGDSRFLHLLNVAISRTQNRLILIGHPAAFDRIVAGQTELRSALKHSNYLSASALVGRIPSAAMWPHEGLEAPKRRTLYVFSDSEPRNSLAEVCAWMSCTKPDTAEVVIPSKWPRVGVSTPGVRLIPMDDVPQFALSDDWARVKVDGVWRLIHGRKTGDVLRDLAIGHVIEAETTADTATARLLCRRCGRGSLELNGSGRLACGECRSTRVLTMADGSVLANLYGLQCPSCRLALRPVQGSTGIFFGCPNYPECTYTQSVREIRG